MPPVVRLNRNQLIEWIESKEAGGGDATELRRALEALGPDQNPPTRRHGARVNSAEELTTAERLNNRVDDLFTGGLSDGLLARLVELDRNHSSKELKAMCVEAGLSAGGDKKELAAKLVAKGASGEVYIAREAADYMEEEGPPALPRGVTYPVLHKEERLSCGLSG